MKLYRAFPSQEAAALRAELEALKASRAKQRVAAMLTVLCACAAMRQTVPNLVRMRTFPGGFRCKDALCPHVLDIQCLAAPVSRQPSRREEDLEEERVQLQEMKAQLAATAC